MDEELSRRDIPVAWVGVEELPLLFADQFVVQTHEDTFILTIGQAVVPAFIGTREQRAQQLAQTAYVQVKPIARLAINPAKFDRLIEVLQEVRGQL